MGETKVHRCPGYEDALVGIPYKGMCVLALQSYAIDLVSLSFPPRPLTATNLNLKLRPHSQMSLKSILFLWRCAVQL